VAKGSLLVCWVTCDEGFGVNPTFLDSVATLGFGLLGRGDPRHPARPEQGGSPSCPVCSAQSQAVGTYGRRTAGRSLGPDIWLLLRGYPTTDGFKCYLCHSFAAMPAERLVWLAGLPWQIELCYRDGQQLFGLGDYEGLSWQGRHRHATLVTLAHIFGVRETLQPKNNNPA